MLSRLYLGVHSLDQVIFGFVLGVYLKFMYNVIFDDLIHNLIAYLLEERK